MKIIFYLILLFCSTHAYSQQDGYYLSYEEALKNPFDVETLDLRGDSITDALYSFVNMKRLLLDGCRMKEISPLISHLKHLKFLRIRQSNLEVVSSALFSLEQLEYIDLSSNKIDSVYFLDNRSLVNLNLAHNRIKKVSSVERLSSLKVANLEGNQLREVSSGFFKLNQLTYLDLSQNRIDEIVEFNGKPELSLQRLYLSRNHLKYLPRFFFEIISLKEVDFSDNEIAIFSPDWKYLVHLEKLFLSGNRMKYSDELIAFEKLKFLFLQRIEHCHKFNITSKTADFKIIRQ